MVQFRNQKLVKGLIVLEAYMAILLIVSGIVLVIIAFLGTVVSPDELNVQRSIAAALCGIAYIIAGFTFAFIHIFKHIPLTNL